MASKIDIQVRDQSIPSELPVVLFFAKGDVLPEGISAGEFDCGPKAICIWRQAGVRQILAGLGPKDELTNSGFVVATGTAMRKARGMGLSELALDLTTWPQFVHSAIEGALLADYKFEDFLPKEKQRSPGTFNLYIYVKPHEANAARLGAKRAEIIASAANVIRGIGNAPGNIISPMTLAAKVKELAESRSGLKVQILEERQLRAQKFGGILAVGQGSDNPPCLIKMEYVGPGVKKGSPIALIGKAITFDSGGISIKPADRMDEMKFDKMGGLAVLGTMLAAADLKLPLHLVGLIPSAENMPSSRATRPGDIICSLDGKTIEIGNTDAEGRIILADAIAHARLAYSPRVIIALSTLTGGVVVALGTKRAGIFMSNPAWLAPFERAASITGEMVWPLPLDGEYLEAMQSEIAFSKNAAGRDGGCCKAASFLKMWAEKTPFVHLDIAGTAWITKEVAHLESGATGYGTRLILAVLQQFADGETVP